METAAEISGSVMMKCVYHTDGTVMVLVTARMALMRWTAVCNISFAFVNQVVVLHPQSPLFSSLATYTCV